MEHQPIERTGFLDTDSFSSGREQRLLAFAEQLTTEDDLVIDVSLGRTDTVLAVARKLGIEVGPGEIGPIIREALALHQQVNPFFDEVSW